MSGTNVRAAGDRNVLRNIDTLGLGSRHRTAERAVRRSRLEQWHAILDGPGGLDDFERDVGPIERPGTRAERVIAFIEGYLKTPEGASLARPLVLRPWQRAMIRRIYDNPGGTRRAIASMPRKNGKTGLTAALLLTHLLGPEARENSGLFSTALSRDQAAIAYSLAQKMVRLNPELGQHIRVRDANKALFCPRMNAIYRALSADSATALGLSPAFVLHDELGQVAGPRHALYEALETSMGAQVDPLSTVISTQSPNDGDLLSLLIDDALTGADPSVVAFCFNAPAEADIFDPEVWKDANPALDDFLSLAEFAENAGRAKRMPSAEASFRNLRLNQRVSAKASLISRTAWMLCRGPVKEDVFTRGEVYGGLDLSGRQALTAAVVVGRYSASEPWHVKARFWTPRIGIRERSKVDKVPYDLWAEQGFIEMTPGASIDFAYVAADLEKWIKGMALRAVAFDRWRINDFKKECDDISFTLPLVPHGQGFKDMAPALDTFEAAVTNSNLLHNGHPVLTFNVANAVVEMDPAGNRKFTKASSTGRIDGAVALAMALNARAVSTEVESELSGYARPGGRESGFVIL